MCQWKRECASIEKNMASASMRMPGNMKAARAEPMLAIILLGAQMGKKPTIPQEKAAPIQIEIATLRLGRETAQERAITRLGILKADITAKGKAFREKTPQVLQLGMSA